MSLELHRRDFLALLGGGLLVGVECEPLEAADTNQIGAWIHISNGGAVSVYTGKCEMGQNVMTSLAQAVAEELSAPIPTIKMVMADTELTPFDAGTFGSQSTPRMAPQLRRAAAATRDLLLDLAANQWGADKSTLKVENGRVIGPSGKAATFGELTKGEKLVKTIPPGIAVAKPAGRDVGKLNGRDVVTGKTKAPSDITRPGMLYGAVVRPSAYRAKLASSDLAAAQAMPGVTVIKDGDFIGVTAPNSNAAHKAAMAVKATWDAPQQPSSKELFSYLKSNTEAGGGRGRGGRGGGGGGERGSIDQGLAQADHKLTATYTLPYIAHAPLEPRAAVAEWSGDKLTVWTGTQRPWGVRDELARTFQLPPERVRVIVPNPGSGYGGKHSGECAVEAARLAKAAGRPVKLVWTREEEFTWAYFRPAAVIEVSSGVTTDGLLTAWDFHNYNGGPSGVETKYEVPNVRIGSHGSNSPLKQGSYRGLAGTGNHFAREVHMDEVAALVKMDPLEFRLKNLKDDRMRSVLRTAAEKFGWSKASNCGLSTGFEKGSYFGTCVEVAMDGATPRVVRVVEAFECGAVVNPDHLRNQIEGAIVMGLGGALTEAIDFENGRILNPRFSKYRVPHFADMPQIEAVLVDRKDLPSAGAGETPIMGIAPAIANAVYKATGKRYRSMPLNRAVAV